MICVIDPFSGLAGDMLLGALLDAGAPLNAVLAAIASTGLTGWQLAAASTVEHGLSATRVRVEVTDTVIERAAAELIGLAGRAEPAPVSAIAVRTLRALAGVEGRLHGIDPGQVHLHELGGHDTLVDIIGVAAAMHLLGIERVFCGPLPMGTGRVTTRHGRLPVPAPATSALLAGARIIGSELLGETVTPTAAALLVGLDAQYGAPPAMTLTATGYGAGTRVLADRPNVAVVRLGEPVPPTGAPPPRPGEYESLVLLETTLDDVTGEVLGYVLGAALGAGALDAWITTATTKKSRPAHVLHVLAEPAETASLTELIFAETGTLGVRRMAVDRTALPRHTTVVDVDGYPVRIKNGPWSAKPEHDDLVAAAARLGRPLREVAELARLADASAMADNVEPAP